MSDHCSPLSVARINRPLSYIFAHFAQNSDVLLLVCLPAFILTRQSVQKLLLYKRSLSTSLCRWSKSDCNEFVGQSATLVLTPPYSRWEIQCCWCAIFTICILAIERSAYHFVYFSPKKKQVKPKFVFIESETRRTMYFEILIWFVLWRLRSRYVFFSTMHTFFAW